MPNPASNPATTAPQPAVLARMFNGLTEGVAIVEGAFGKNGWVIAHSNPALSKLSGYAPAELQKMTHGKLHKDRSDLAAMRRWAKQGADAAPPSLKRVISSANTIRRCSSPGRSAHWSTTRATSRRS